MAIQNPKRWIITNETDQLELVDTNTNDSYNLDDPINMSDLIAKIELLQDA